MQRVSTGVIKSLKCNCTGESGYCQRQRGISRSEAGGRGWEMSACSHFRSWSSGRKEAGLGYTWSKQYSSSKNSMRAEWRSWVLAVDKAYHLLFIPHRYLMGILCEENETNTWEPKYPFKLQALFFFIYRPPMSSWLPLKLLCTLVNSAVQLAGATNNISTSHTCFSHQMRLSGVSCLLEKIGSRSGSVWPSALLVAKATSRVCLSKRSLLTGTCRASNRAACFRGGRAGRKLRSRNNVMIIISCAGGQIKPDRYQCRTALLSIHADTN